MTEIRTGFPRNPTHRALRSEQRSSRISPRGWAILAPTVLACVSLAAWLALLNGGSFVSKWLPLGLLAFCAGVFSLVRENAQDVFHTAWCAHRGLRVVQEAAYEGALFTVNGERVSSETAQDVLTNLKCTALPVLRYPGTRWQTTHNAVGTVWGAPFRFAMLTCVERGADTQTTIFSGGVVTMTLPLSVADRFAGISTRLRGSRGDEEGMVDNLDFLNSFQLESIELQNLMRLYATTSQDHIAVHELFHPGFMVRLSKEPVAWDQSGGALLVLDPNLNPGDSKGRDDLCRRAHLVYQGYLSESR